MGGERGPQVQIVNVCEPTNDSQSDTKNAKSTFSAADPRDGIRRSSYEAFRGQRTERGCCWLLCRMWSTPATTKTHWQPIWFTSASCVVHISNKHCRNAMDGREPVLFRPFCVVWCWTVVVWGPGQRWPMQFMCSRLMVCVWVSGFLCLVTYTDTRTHAHLCPFHEIENVCARIRHILWPENKINSRSSCTRIWIIHM